MKRIAYTRPDGGVSIVIPSEGARLVAAAVVRVEGADAPVTFDPPLQWDRSIAPLLKAGANIVSVVAEPDDEFLARLQAKDVPADATDVRLIEETELPDRSLGFRNAWVLGPDGIEHDLDKARAIKRDLLRTERAPLLAALDVEYQRADEAGDAAAKAAVAAKKQALRDVTDDPAIEAAETTEDLKAVQPVARDHAKAALSAEAASMKGS